MRQKLLACLIAAAASLSAGFALADEGTDAGMDTAVSTEVETTTEIVGTTEDTSAATEDTSAVTEESGGSAGGEVSTGDGSAPEVAVDPVPVSEELPTYDVVDEGSAGGDVDPVVDEEQPVALEGGEVPVEGGPTAVLYTTTGADGAEGDADPQLMYTTRGPEGCMECRTLTGVPENLGPEAPAPEVTADVIDDNATPAQSARAKRKSPAN